MKARVWGLAAVLLLLVPASAQAANPTAVLGVPAQVEAYAPIALTSAGSSDPDAHALVEFRWTVGTRTTVRTYDATYDAPGLPAGTYTVTLRVKDANGESSAAVQQQLVVRDGARPTAVLDAPERAAVGAPVRLSAARSSDIGGQVKQYRWTVASRPVIVTPDATFDAPGLPSGVHQASLVVVDDAGNESLPDRRTIIVDGEAPTAVLDVPERVNFGTRPALSAARSFDVLGKLVIYTFAVDDGPPVRTDLPALSVAPLPVGRHTATLRVTDDSGHESAPIQAVFFVVDAERPTAVVRAPASVTAGTAFTLDGTRSTDVGGRIVQYRWTVAGGAPVVTPDPTFTAAGIATTGTKLITLVVVDDSGNESLPITASVSVTAPTGTKLTTFTITTLLAPQRKRTSQIFLGDRMLLAGRVFSPKATRLRVTFLRGGRRLGRTTVDIPARGVARLALKLSPAQVRGLRVGQRLRVRLRARTGGRVVTRSVPFSVVSGTMPAS